ncbi:MAG: 3'-5' exoribonuclease [Calditrichaceae bacterium]|nr:3'-5' exoribonuclease [Calditrichaceae bacterium]
MEELRADLLRYLGLQTFVVVDLETTGLDPEKDKIIEIGAIRFENGKETNAFEHLVNPGIPIPEFITRLTGIKDADVQNMPVINEVFPRLEQFIGDAAFVGQQVNFDASFLEYHYRSVHNDFHNWDDQALRFKYLKNFRLDTLFIARILMPFQEKFKLGNLAAYFGYNLENAHQAVEDASATAHVFLHLLDRVLGVDNETLANIINLLFANSRRAKSFFVTVLNFKNERKINISSLPLLDDAKLAGKYYNVLGDLRKKVMPDEEALPEAIDEQNILEYFESGGRLAHVIKGYEQRDQQRQMAQTIVHAVNDSAFVVAEAGTGTGKSMAYLIPAVEFAVRNRHIDHRIIISTNTKNLQEQLFFKDIPTLFSARRGDFSAVILKGRSNYLCLDKWHYVMTDVNQRLSQDERSRVLPLVLWVENTKTGDIAENEAFQIDRNIGLWSKFVAESSYCPGKSCKYYEDCFLMKARRNAQTSDIVVVNHSLLFSDLAADHVALNEYRNLIIDEAHNIENAAAEYLGARVSFWTFRNLYHKLYDEEPKKSGALQQLDLRISQGKIDDHKSKEITNISRALKYDNIRLKEHVLIFYNELSRLLREKYIKNGGLNEENRVRYFKNFKFFGLLSQQIDDIKAGLKAVIQKLGQLLDNLNRLKAESFEFQDQVFRELLSIRTDFEELSQAFDFCLAADTEKYVYWLEIPRNIKSNDIILFAAPLNIAELLKTRLYDNLDLLVLSSATLTVNKEFDYFLQRTGLNLLEDKKLVANSFGSPFDFPNQLMIGVADYMPDPRNDQFAGQLADNIKLLHQQHRTGMLVLFTNYSLLNRMYDDLKSYFDGERILLLAQGKGNSRTNLINQFREFNDSVLFGTDSFWEGIDVPGEALELLVIPKLPFDVPSDPVVEARMEEIKKAGGNAFLEYSVPEAIIKFRQGFGRLIRTKSDFGAVIITDNRLSRMQYGKHFLNSLPAETSVFKTQKELLSAIKGWFDEKKHKG